MSTFLDAERFFRAIGRAVMAHHSRPSGLPLILVRLASRRIAASHRFDQGELRVLARGPRFESLLSEAFDQIRQNERALASGGGKRFTSQSGCNSQ